jgi:hypothetical protein
MILLLMQAARRREPRGHLFSTKFVASLTLLAFLILFESVFIHVDQW